jgi:hypothetical protein
MRSKMPKKKSNAHQGRSDYKPSIEEQRALNEFSHRSEAASPAPRLKVIDSRTSTDISLDHPDKFVAGRLLTRALGSVSEDFVKGILTQVSKAISGAGHVDEQLLNFAIDVIKDIKPSDQVEAMLATQIAMTHMAFMTFARKLAHVENILQQDSAVNAFNKLARTYTAQMDALKRYRTGGEQKVTVQHVSVNDGGQAIVGDVVQAPRPSDRQHATEALADARRPPMRLLENAKGEATPLKRAQTDDK